MANLASQNTVHPVDDRAFSIRELLLMNIPNNFKWSEISEEELNNLPLEEKQQFLKENEAKYKRMYWGSCSNYNNAKNCKEY